jgi:hypothetical protein
MKRHKVGTVTTVKLPKAFIARLKSLTGQRNANRAVKIVCEQGIRFTKRLQLKALAGTLHLSSFEEGQQKDISRDHRLQKTKKH